ncbi:MAG: penicillin-binding protein 2 [Desulfobacterales bacterium]|nr:penicillin-binding protein 2 [Desulfobacterales bacterium]
MDQFLRTADSNWFRQRLKGFILCVMAAFVVLFVRLFFLQVIEREEYRRLSENNSIRLQSIKPPRGLIFDRNGELLVDNRPSFDLSIITKDAKPLEKTLVRLTYFLEAPLEELQSKILRTKGYSAYTPILLKQDIGRDALARVEVHKFDLPGVGVNVEARRHYINQNSAAHLVGYLSEINAEELKSGKYLENKGGDFIGRFGVEKTYERYLRGERGGRQVEVNATGQVVRVLKTVEATSGHNVYLTIDTRLQKKAEELLLGRAGAVIAMDPASGEILALASNPSFDQNDFVSGMSHEQWEALVSNPQRPLENKALQGEYPPASTYKIVTAMAALEEGVIDEDTTAFCPGYYNFGDREFRCWKEGGHGTVDVIKALSESCDVFFYQTGLKLGVDRLGWYAKASGLGSPTEINLDNEAIGLVPTANWKKNRTGVEWQRGETLSVAIGQGYNLATPLQMLVLTSSVANGGTLYRPLILKQIETAEGKIVLDSEMQSRGKLPVSRRTLDIVRKGLWEVVNSPTGTARNAQIPGVEVSGKTGTAQVVGRKQDDAADKKKAPVIKPHAWFVAYAPSRNPLIAVAVIVEHGEGGGSVAAPIAREVLKVFFADRKSNNSPLHATLQP